MRLLTNHTHKSKAYYEICLSWIVALSIAGYPLIGLFVALLEIPSRLGSVPFRIFVAALSIGVLITNMKTVKLNVMLCFILSWLFLYWLRLLFNVLDELPKSTYEMIFFLLVVVFPVLSALTSKSQQLIESAQLKIICLSTMVILFAILGETIGLFGSYSLSFTGRLSTLTVNPITLGHLSGTLLLSTMSCAMTSKNNNYFLLGTLFLIALCGLSMTNSRGAFLAVFLPFVIYLMVNIKKKKANLKTFAPIFAIVSLVVVYLNPVPMNFIIDRSLKYYISINFPGNEIQNFEEAQKSRALQKEERFQFSDDASSFRWILWKTSIQAVKEAPFIGKSNWEVHGGYYPHNSTLEAFQNLGVFGGVCYFTLLVSGFLRSLRYLYHGKVILPILFFQSVIACQFSGSLYASAQFWLLLTLLFVQENKKGGKTT